MYDFIVSSIHQRSVNVHSFGRYHELVFVILSKSENLSNIFAEASLVKLQNGLYVDGVLYWVIQLSYIQLIASVNSGSLLTFVHTKRFDKSVSLFVWVGDIIVHV